MKMDDYRVVVGIDFGTTHSGFAYAHKKSPHLIYTKADWVDYPGRLKVPTVLLYDDEYENVQSWGFSALAKKPNRRNKSKIDKKPVELFKLHLGNMPNKPPLPDGLDYKKAITDYLHEFGKVIKETISEHWKIDFYTQTLIILTISTEFGVDVRAIATMRECAFKAGLLKDPYSRNLRFTTELEATTIHCLKCLKVSPSVGETIMVVSCGNKIVDLAIKRLLEGEKLSGIIERSKDDCGSDLVNQEFLKFLERKVGSSAINLVRENEYSQLQFMIQEFCRMVKMKFTGVKSDFQPTELELDLDDLCPALMQHCKGDYRSNMEEDDWTVILKFEDVKAMFDPVIERIIQLIDSQLRSNSDHCSVLFLVDEFSESKYLQSRIKQTFGTRVPLIVIPPQPVTAVVKGAVEYGLNEEIITLDDIFIESVYRLESRNIIAMLEEGKKRLQYEIQKSNDNLNQIEEQHLNKIQQLESQIDDHQSEITLREQSIGQLQQSLQLKENEIQESNNSLNQIKEQHLSKVQQLESQINDHQSKITLQEQSIDQLQQSLKLKDDQIQEYNNNLNQIKEQHLQQFESQINDHQSKIMLQEQNIDQLQQSLKLKEDEIQQHLSKVQQLESQIDDHQNKITLQEQNIDQLQQSLKLKDQEFDNNVNQIKKQHLNKVQQLESQVGDHQNKITLQEQSIDQLQQSLKLKEDKIQESDNDIKQHLNKAQQLESQIVDHRSKITSQEQNIDQLQQSLKLKEDKIQENENNLSQIEEQYLNTIQQLEHQITEHKVKIMMQKQSIDQLQQIINQLQKFKESQFKEIESRHSRSSQQLKDNINQKHIGKIMLQKQSIDQLQQSLKLKENQIKDIKEQHLESVKQLEDRISDISQQYISKIKLHEQNIDQLKQSLEFKENQTKETKEQHLKSVQQLEDRISDISQQYISKTKLQEQNIDQLKQSLELKESQIKETKEQHLKSVQQLEDRISDISQQYISKTKLQGQNIDQLKQSLELKENQIKEIKEQHQLEDRISDISQQYISKTKLQGQNIDQLKQSLELKENQIKEIKEQHQLEDRISDISQQYISETRSQEQNIDQSKQEIKEQHPKNIQRLEDQINNNISQQHQNKIKLQEQRIDQLQQSENVNLENRLKNLIQQDVLSENEESNYQLYDAQNYNNDIVELNDNLKEYITDLNQDVIVNIEEVEKLLLLYECPTKITNQNNDQLLIQAVLQRHVIETIFSYATKYFQSTGQHHHLESDIVNRAYSLFTLLTNTSKYRSGNKEVTRVVLTKLRQQIFLILNDCGFTDISVKNDVTHEHPFIVYHKKQLNKIMNELRTIQDSQKRIASENLAATIIHEVIKTFWFRFKVKEPVVQYVWIPHNAQIDEELMEGDDFDNVDSRVDLCYFPLIGRDLKSNNRKIYTVAKVLLNPQKT